MSVPPGQDLPGPDDRPASPLQALAADTAARLQAQALRALVAAFEHLLRQQGWVSSHRVGRQVSYRLDDQVVHHLLHWIGAGHA